MRTASPIPRRALSVEEAAASVGVHPAHIYRLIWRGELRAKRSGRRWLIPVEVLEAFLAGDEDNDAATGATPVTAHIGGLQGHAVAHRRRTA